MSYPIDFGFEGPTAQWADARVAYFFVGRGTPADLGKLPGPVAIADATRFVELFETQSEVSLAKIGTYAEVIAGPGPLNEAVRRTAEAKASRILPVIIGSDRRTTGQCCAHPLVALWGKVGRSEANEHRCTNDRTAVLCGVRAATSQAFKAIPGNVTIITARGLASQPDVLDQALSRLNGPVHLSIDIDVLAPGAALCPRSLEPGGLSYYDLTDTIARVFDGPKVASVDLVGTDQIAPSSAAAVLSAQILVKLAGLAYASIDR